MYRLFTLAGNACSSFIVGMIGARFLTGSDNLFLNALGLLIILVSIPFTVYFGKSFINELFSPTKFQSKKGEIKIIENIKFGLFLATTFRETLVEFAMKIPEFYRLWKQIEAEKN